MLLRVFFVFCFFKSEKSDSLGSVASHANKLALRTAVSSSGPSTFDFTKVLCLLFLFMFDGLEPKGI